MWVCKVGIGFSFVVVVVDTWVCRVGIRVSPVGVDNGVRFGNYWY